MSQPKRALPTSSDRFREAVQLCSSRPYVVGGREEQKRSNVDQSSRGSREEVTPTAANPSTRNHAAVGWGRSNRQQGAQRITAISKGASVYWAESACCSLQRTDVKRFSSLTLGSSSRRRARSASHGGWRLSASESGGQVRRGRTQRHAVSASLRAAGEEQST